MLTLPCVFPFVSLWLAFISFPKCSNSVSIPKIEISNYYKTEFQLEYNQLLT